MTTKTYQDLVGQTVRATLSRSTLSGARYGVVRRAVHVGNGLRTLTFQLVLPERVDRSSTRSATCRGKKVTLRGRELDTLAVRLRGGRFVPLAEWMTR